MAPGEELLIDYGSSSKSMYRFARTYGFISYSKERDSRSALSLKSALKDTLRVNVEVSPPLLSVQSPFSERAKNAPKNELWPNEGFQESSGLGLMKKPAGTGTLSTSSGKGTPVPEAGKGPGAPGRQEIRGTVGPGDSVEEQVFQLDVAVHLADVGGDSPVSKKEATSAQTANTGSSTALEGTKGRRPLDSDVDNSAAIRRALDDRLRRYGTTLVEDLALLRNEEAMAVHSTIAAVTKGLGSGLARERESLGSGVVTAEWVDLCVSVRAAEKIALERELRERCSGTGGERS